MGECCSTSKLADESQNQVELFEVMPISTNTRGQSQSVNLESSGFKRRKAKGQNNLQTEIQEQKSEDDGSLERRVIWNEYPLSLYNSQVNSPILTNRSSFNNTLPMRESLTGRVQDHIFISSDIRAPDASRIPSTAKKVSHSFVDIAGYDTAQMSTFMCNSTRLGLETNLSPTETVETSQRAGQAQRVSSNQEVRGGVNNLKREEKKRGCGGFLFRQQPEGMMMATKSDRNSVYVQGTKIGTNLQEESRPRTQSSYIFQNHNSVSSEQMAIEVFS